MRILFFCLALAGLTLMGCESTNPNYQQEAADPAFFHRSMKQLTDVIVHDIFSPPVASRIYAYPTIAAYEIAAQGDSTYRGLVGQLTDLNALPQPEADQEYCFPLASIHAFLTVGKELIFSVDSMAVFQEKIYQEFKIF